MQADTQVTAEVVDRCKGCIMGALVGDAAGAPIEFARNINAETIEKAMKMLGGGELRVSPGQITDDGELTLAVLAGLACCTDGYDPNKICIEYGRWVTSDPFDIGRTTRNALYHASSMTNNLSPKVTAAALKFGHSISNGSTMKLSPTAVYCSFFKEDKDLIAVTTTETRHVHSNQNVVDCNIAFCLAIRDLVQGRSADIAFASQKAFVAKSSISAWLSEMEAGQMQPVNKNIGFVKIAYQQAFYHLKKGSSFEDAIRAVIIQGGDSDTNACIVGMLLGARDGLEKLPKDMVQAVLACDCKMLPRPKGFQPGHVFEDHFGKLMQNCAKLSS